MVNLAAEEARTLGLAQVRFERMDAEALTFDAATFDVALCALGLMYVPDPLKALTEMHRVLRPGGRAVAAVWGARIAAAGRRFFRSSTPGWRRRSARCSSSSARAT